MLNGNGSSEIGSSLGGNVAGSQTTYYQQSTYQGAQDGSTITRDNINMSKREFDQNVINKLTKIDLQKLVRQSNVWTDESLRKMAIGLRYSQQVKNQKGKTQQPKKQQIKNRNQQKKPNSNTKTRRINRNNNIRAQQTQ